MPANDERIPEHYRSDGYIHWDFVIRTGMGYLEGNATKYISRWRKKNGLQDLQKALHYIDKLLEGVSVECCRVFPLNVGNLDLVDIAKEGVAFGQANNLTEGERSAILDLASWEDRSDILSARTTVLMLIEQAETKPVPASDSNKHAERT